MKPLILAALLSLFLLACAEPAAEPTATPEPQNRPVATCVLTPEPTATPELYSVRNPVTDAYSVGATISDQHELHGAEPSAWQAHHGTRYHFHGIVEKVEVIGDFQDPLRRTVVKIKGLPLSCVFDGTPERVLTLKTQAWAIFEGRFDAGNSTYEDMQLSGCLAAQP